MILGNKEMIPRVLTFLGAESPKGHKFKGLNGVKDPLDPKGLKGPKGLRGP